MGSNSSALSVVPRTQMARHLPFRRYRPRSENSHVNLRVGHSPITSEEATSLDLLSFAVAFEDVWRGSFLNSSISSNHLAKPRTEEVDTVDRAKEVATAESCEDEQLRTDLIAQHGLVDLSRIPPKAMIRDARAREALRSELNGILQKGSNNIPIGRLVKLSGPLYLPVQRLRTTIVTKFKPGEGFKCRLCIR